MLLKDWLKMVKCKTIKIGYDKGSSFVYCGPLNSSKLTETLEKQSQRYRDYQLKRLERLKEQIKACEYELSLPVMALDRHIVDEYPSRTEDGQVIVTIEGINDGDYWDISEFEKGEVDE